MIDAEINKGIHVEANLAKIVELHGREEVDNMSPEELYRAYQKIAA